jgi:UDP-glucose 4-epimerase
VDTSTRDLVRMVNGVTGGEPEVIYNPRNEGGVRRMCADIGLADKLLNYQPAIGLAAGLRLTLEKDAHIRAK